MLPSALFLVIAGIPIFLVLRRIRTLKLSWGSALVLTVPITIGLWCVIYVIVNLGRV